MTATPGPAAIDVDRETGVTFAWHDDTTSHFGLEDLRVHCPCADCRMRRERGQPIWPLPSSPRPLLIVNAELVGAWGLGITWNDGHSTGIYSWELLRGAAPANGPDHTGP